MASFISLRPLYSFVKSHRKEYERALNLKTELGEEYCKLCEQCTEGIGDELHGIYVWGEFDKRNYWNSIYLGKAGIGKTKKLLRQRITEELKDERCFLWRHVLSEGDLFRAGPKVHRGGKEKWDKYIRKAWERSVKKKGATHIIFAPTRKLDNDGVRQVEAELIEALKPKENASRPVPPSHVVKEATDIFQHLRQTIHQIRALRRYDDGPFTVELV